MPARFEFDLVAALLVALAALAGMLLALRFAARGRTGLVLLQLVAAGLLLAALSLREAPAPSTLLVLTPGAELSAVGLRPHARPVQLPGAPGGEGIEPVPDLATALRRHPADRLVIAGAGLARHDRESVGARAVEFLATPPAAGPAVLELDVPVLVRAGTWWTLRGRTHDASGAELVLLDPGGAETAKVKADDDGRFEVQTLARAAGPALYELQLRIDDKPVQALPVPVVAESAAPLRVLLLAASPSPELKYLRRWALDSGAQLEARVALAPGFAQRRGSATLDAAQLAELDLLVVDERSWPQLGALQPALRDAVAAGLGLMVRVTGPVPDRIAQEWKAWGLEGPFAVTPIAVRLPGMSQPALHAWGTATDSAVPTNLATVDGAALAQWRALGRGRVGLWRLADTHRLYTRGDRERHAMLWSDAWSTLARPRGAPAAHLRSRAVAGERVVICGVPDDASVLAPDGGAEALTLVDGCAAYWPRKAGWHRLQPGDALSFHVHDTRGVESLLAEERRVATAALVRGDVARPPSDVFDRDRARASLLAAWLTVMALAWWMERRAMKAAPRRD